MKLGGTGILPIGAKIRSPFPSPLVGYRIHTFRISPFSPRGRRVGDEGARVCAGDDFLFLRFWNNDILSNRDGVLTAILAALGQN
jgi:hypothetical protein